jgi:TolB protein
LQPASGAAAPQLFNVTQNPANDWTQAWSPDGKRIAFTSNRAGNWEIFLINVDGTGLVQLTDDGQGRLSPVWSPDGTQMAYSGKQGEEWDIFSMPAPSDAEGELEAGQARRLTSVAGNDISPTYSPGGDMIAFESNRDGDAEIYVMQADGSSQRNISNSPSSKDQGPVWTPDNRHLIFYSDRNGNWDIYMSSLDGGDVVNLTQTPNIDEQEPMWRP